MGCIAVSYLLEPELGHRLHEIAAQHRIRVLLLFQGGVLVKRGCVLDLDIAIRTEPSNDPTFSSSDVLSALSVFWKVSLCRDDSDSTRSTHCADSLKEDESVIGTFELVL